MSWFDELPRWQKNIGAAVFLLTLAGAAFVAIPTPFHMDAEAAQIQQQADNAQGCAAVYELEARISEAELQLLNPEVPGWYKAELNRKLPVWRETLKRLRAQYQCVEYAH